MDNYTIAESYTLPSKGLVYDTKVNPNIRIRSMTTEEEMKRLGYSNLQYKMLAEIIDDCLIEKPGISAYDMCISDYQFLLFKLREVTYGKDYKTITRCPVCGESLVRTIDLSKLDVVEYSNEMDKYFNITLPRTKKQLKIRLQTPRMLDDVKVRAEEQKKKYPDLKGEPAFLFTLESVIVSVDGEVLDPVKLSTFVRHLPMMDANYILKSLDKISFGLESIMNTTCDSCGANFSYPFPFTSEFFGPGID